MKKVLALTAGVLVALAPTGTAFAEQVDPVNVRGKAYGNCGHSSKGGTPHTGTLRLEYNKGNGGLITLSKKDGMREVGCVLPEEEIETPVVEKPQPLPGWEDGAR